MLVGFFETSANVYQTTWRYSTEHINVQDY